MEDMRPDLINMADHQAQVTLTSLNTPTIVPAKRVLHLNPSRRIIAIGRASKSISKGLVACVDNAWFDSPVMSRNHAEIVLHSDNKTLQLQDVGSMHGTVLNDQEMQLNEPRSLNNGDVVKFGAEVRRGSETFPACSFKIEYQFSPYRTSTNRNQLSESSEGDDLTNSEDEDMPDARASSDESVRGHTSSESPASKRSTSVEIVETYSGPQGLTEDQVVEDISNMKKSPTSSVHAGNAEDPVVVDSDDDQGTDEEEEMSDIYGNPSDSGDSDIPNPFFNPSDDESDSEEEEEDEASDEEVRRLSDNRGIKVSNVRTTGFGALLENDDESEVDSNPSLDQCSMMSDLESHLIGEDSEDNDSVEYDSVESVMGDAGVSYQISEVQSDSHEDSSDNLSSDDESETGITFTLGDVSKYEIMEKALASENEKESSSNALPSKLRWNDSSAFHASQYPGEAVSAKNEARTSLGREPSPSDAAMVKDEKATTVGNTPDVEQAEKRDFSVSPVLHQDLPGPHDAFAQSMGRKTGKVAFFQAREENRVKLGSKVEAPGEMKRSQGPASTSITRPKLAPRPTQASPRLPMPTFGSTSLYVPRLQQLNRARQQELEHTQQAVDSLKKNMARRRELEQTQRQADHITETRRAQLAAHAQLRRMETKRKEEVAQASTQAAILRAASLFTVDPRSILQHRGVQQPTNPFSRTFPTHDMTSSFARNTSKVSNDAEKSAERFPARSSVPISDLVENSNDKLQMPGLEPNFSVHVPQNNKRKADAISDLSEEEHAVEKSKIDVPMTDVEKSTETASVSNLSVQSSPAPPVLPDEPVEHRPKRLKRVAEKVGYAALGGVLGGAAFGAGLFAALVITAPDFL